MTTLGAFTNSLFVLTMASALQKAYWDINVTEAKKNELERQKTFLLGFSHELRNLINSITITIQLCLLEEIPLKVKDLLQSSQVCGELLSHLVNNILDTGKAEIGELEVNPSANNVFDLLEKIWGVLSQLIMNQKLYGRMQINKNVPRYLQIDNHRLTQIMLNLVGNAIKFTEKGSVSVEISWIEGKDKADDKVFSPIPFDEEDEGIFEKAQKLSRLTEDSIVMDAHCKTKIKYVGRREHQLHSEKGILKITVSDTGCGIGPDQIPQLFNKFTQVCSSSTKKTLGTGLGLFITKQLIHKMGGEVRVFSKVDRGSAFIACIPAKVVEEPQDTTLLENTAPAFNPGLTELKVMVVDDSEFNRKILTKCLNKLGVQVQEVAHNGRQAVDKYKEHIQNGKSFDVITMDVDMPVMDGKEATELIREYERLHNLRAALIATISGNVTESEIGECLNKNGSKQADFFFKKPTSIEDLAFIIKKRRATQIPV
jgi:signal transduction histidine kinase/CheY-like chemotaxis protein